LPFNENKRKQAHPDKEQLPKKIESRTKLLKAALSFNNDRTTKKLSEETGLTRPTVNKWMGNAPDSFVNEGCFIRVGSRKENVWIPNPMAQHKGEITVQDVPIVLGSLNLPPHASGQDLLIHAQISGLHSTKCVDFGLKGGRRRIDLRPHSGNPSHTEIFWTNVGGQLNIPIQAQGVNVHGQCAIDVEAIRLPSNVNHENVWNHPQQEKDDIHEEFKVKIIPLKLLESQETQSSGPSEDTRIQKNNDDSFTDNGDLSKGRTQGINIWSDGE
jgi:hypothetical protein